MLSDSSLGPYQLPAPMLMHPSAIGNTSGPCAPSFVFAFVMRPLYANLPAMRRAGIALLGMVASCDPAPATPKTPVDATTTKPASADAGWGKFHSKRFNLS